MVAWSFEKEKKEKKCWDQMERKKICDSAVQSDTGQCCRKIRGKLCVFAIVKFMGQFACGCDKLSESLRVRARRKLTNKMARCLCV